MSGELGSCFRRGAAITDVDKGEGDSPRALAFTLVNVCYPSGR